MDLPLAGKTAIITGSSRGIGASIAQKLASDGVNVVINYHGNDASACILMNTVNARGGGRAVLVKADVGTIEGGRLLLEKAMERLGVPDILVLNAGIMGHRVLSEVDEAYYDLHFRTNVKGPLFLVQAAAEVMKSGLIFAATKGAVEQLVRVLSKDLGARGITVNAIAPGPVDTPLFREGKPQQLVDWIAQLHPQKRIPTPDEISPIVSFLAKDEAAWINGQTIMVNGVGMINTSCVARKLKSL